MNGHKIPGSWQREWYETVGGTPQLDQNYTVYGEVVFGIDIVDHIAAVNKDERDRPVVDVPMTVELLSKSECKQLDKILGTPNTLTLFWMVEHRMYQFTNIIKGFDTSSTTKSKFIIRERIFTPHEDHHL